MNSCRTSSRTTTLALCALRPVCYLAYLDRHGSLAKRFCDAGTRAWVVYGENDDIGITRDEREVLAAASHVTLIEIADTGHFALNQKPDEIAAIVLQAVSSATG